MMGCWIPWMTNTGSYVNASDTGTDPKNPDTDGDGFDDGMEVVPR